MLKKLQKKVKKLFNINAHIDVGFGTYDLKEYLTIDIVLDSNVDVDSALEQLNKLTNWFFDNVRELTYNDKKYSIDDIILDVRWED